MPIHIHIQNSCSDDVFQGLQGSEASQSGFLFTLLLNGVIVCRSEVFLMMRTLRDMNMSKFVAEDVPLFISLIEDLFPAQKADRAQFPDISAALEKVRVNASQLDA